MVSTEVTCREALKNSGKIKIGMKDTGVLDLLGKPTNVDKGVWAYNFWDCSPPPKPGSQIVVGLALTFKDKAIAKIDYATICATGPGN